MSCLRGKLARAVLRGGDGGNTVSLLDYDWREHAVQDIREGVFYPTRLASQQGRLIPLTPRDSLIVYRAKSPKRRMPHVSPPPQLLLFEVMAVG